MKVFIRVISFGMPVALPTTVEIEEEATYEEIMIKAGIDFDPARQVILTRCDGDEGFTVNPETDSSVIGENIIIMDRKIFDLPTEAKEAAAASGVKNE